MLNFAEKGVYLIMDERNREVFVDCVERHKDVLERIRKSAHELHDGVNQKYGNLPYGFHLDKVTGFVYKYGHLVCMDEADVVPLFFGAFYHDSIEDARLTYNDTVKAAQQFMTDNQAFMAAEIVYALTNDKGRTRAERAGERYYQGIRTTPYAPFVKLADRMANISYSFSHADGYNDHMKEVYANELPHFLDAINAHSDDIRLSLPQEMVEELKTICLSSSSPCSVGITSRQSSL